MNEDYEQLRAELDRKWRSLGNFLDPKHHQLDDEERKALNPIFHSLTSMTLHYTEPELIGEGGEKQILKVRDLRTDRMVAMAKPLARATDEEKEEFLREARLTACLQHPNIMTIYDQGVDEDGIPYFTMELVQGDNLKEIVEKLAAGESGYLKQYPRERLLEIFIKVCDAVSYAHSRGVVHLDIKPANIKVGPFGEVHLCDWGLSRILTLGFDAIPSNKATTDNFPNSDLLNDLTASGLAKGTPGFMAPEQADGVSRVSEKTDVYALGAVLYYLLSFQAPILGNSTADIREKTGKGYLEPMGKVTPEPEIPKGLKATAMKALSLNPRDRFPSVRELREELDRHLLGYPTRAQRAGPIDRLHLLFRRRPGRFLISGVSLLVLVIALGISSVQIDQSRREAFAARDLAEENLRLYTEETARSKQLDDHMRSVTNELQSNENYLDATSKTRLLRFQLEEGNLNPDDRTALAHRLAMLHFVRQQFEQAKTYFEISQETPSNNMFYRLTLKYESVPLPDDRWLDPRDLRDIINEIPSRYDNVCYALAFYFLRVPKSKNQSEKLLPLVESLLDRLNHKGPLKERSNTLKLEIHPQGYVLSLTGKNYNIYHLPLPVRKRSTCVLNSLELYSLQLSEADLPDMIQLEGSGIKELDFTGIDKIPQYQLELLQDLNLHTLIHSLSIPDKELQELLPRMELIRVN